MNGFGLHAARCVDPPTLAGLSAPGVERGAPLAARCKAWLKRLRKALSPLPDCAPPGGQSSQAVCSDNCQKQVAEAKVLICTTGVIHVASEGYRQHIAERLLKSSICVREEAQQPGDIKGAYAQSLPCLGCLQIVVGDFHQGQGGIEDDSEQTKAN